VLCGSAFKNKGVQPMLDAVIDYLPSPLDVAAATSATRRARTTSRSSASLESTEPFSGLAFKVATHPFFGKLTYVRVYSGKVDSGAQVVNATKGKKERIGKLFQMHSNKENPVETAPAGHIYAVIGLKDTTTGDTLCDPSNQVVLESMTFPEPGHRGRHRAQDQGDQEKLAWRSRSSPKKTRPSRCNQDQETGQTVIGGMGELHLDILVDRMRREFKVEANVGKPQVAYRETIKRSVSSTTTPTRSRPVVRVSSRRCRSSPRADGSHRRGKATYEFENKVTGGRVPARVHPRRSTPESRTPCRSAFWPATPLVGVKASSSMVQYHDVDSSEMAFKIAGSMALKEAARKANPVLLEPLMAVEVTHARGVHG
jgi:elongation factor G